MTKRLVNVMNVITEEKYTYYNSLSLRENLISAIILSTEDSRKVLHREYRNKIGVEAKIESISSINGNTKEYSQAFDMIAYEV